jgi:hypothetical protein
VRDTHFLSSANGRTSQDTERKRECEGRPRTVECRRKDKSGHKRKRESEKARGTHFLSSSDGWTSQDLTPRESKRARGAYFLSSADEGTSQDTHKKRESEAHSLPVKHRCMDMSGHQKKPRGPEALTPCRIQREGQVRTTRESERARETHQLSSTVGRISRDTMKGRESEGHSPPVECRQKNISGH